MPRPESREFEIFPWDRNFETGIDEIDREHRRLVAILNNLALHLSNRSGGEVLSSIFSDLLDYANYHFQHEEAVWESHFPAGDAWLQDHVKSHEDFATKIHSLKAKESAMSIDEVTGEIVSYLSQWLGYHILATDKRMAYVIHSLSEGMSLDSAKAHANVVMSGSIGVLVDTILAMYDKISTRTMDLMREKALRIQAERALLSSEERWRFIVEDSGETIWDWDVAAGVKHSSESEDGGRESPMVGAFRVKHLLTEHSLRIHPEDITRVREALQNHFDGKTEFYSSKHREIRHDGSWRWIHTRGKVVERDQNGAALRMVGTHTNITEREIGSLIFHHGDQAIIVVDAQDLVISINPAFSKIAGYAEADIVGKNPKFLIAGEQKKEVLRRVNSSLRESGSWAGEIEVRKRSGESFPALINVLSVQTLEHLVDHLIVILSDVSHQKQIDYTLRQAHKMDAISLLAGGVSHDFNNLLGIILGNLELVNHQISPHDQTYNSFANIAMAAERGERLIKQLLRFSQQGPHRPEPVNIGQVITRMNSLISSSLTPDIFVEMDFPEDLWLTKIDETDFEEVILNLVVNARDSIEFRGGLTFHAFNAVLADKFCRRYPQLQPGEYVTLIVKDTGRGFSPKTIDRIFEPFYSTKELGKGTGLGLSMVYSFAERAGGTATVESEIGVGTSFRLFLPRTKDQPVVESQRRSGAVRTRQSSAAAILVVDDEPGLLSVAREFLELNGYRVFTALGGVEALQILNERQEIKLLFTDVFMPGGMTGYELAEQALRLNPDLKVLFTSGYLESQQQKLQHSFSDAEVIDKPYRYHDVVRQIDEMLNTPTSDPRTSR